MCKSSKGVPPWPQEHHSNISRTSPWRLKLYEAQKCEFINILYCIVIKICIYIYFHSYICQYIIVIYIYIYTYIYCINTYLRIPALILDCHRNSFLNDAIIMAFAHNKKKTGKKNIGYGDTKTKSYFFHGSKGFLRRYSCVSTTRQQP